MTTFESEGEEIPPAGIDNGYGGVATAIWAPPRPTLTVGTDLPAQDNYEVRVYDEKRNSRLRRGRRDHQPGELGSPGASAGVRREMRGFAE